MKTQQVLLPIVVGLMLTGPGNSNSHADAPIPNSLVTSLELVPKSLASNPPSTGTPPRSGGGGSNLLLDLQFKQPPDVGAPGGRSQGGASRGGCPQTEHPLTALVPVFERPVTGLIATIETVVWGQAASAQPTLWFYLPYSSKVADSVEFSLQNAQAEDVYRASVAPPAQPGLVRVTVPDAINLVPGEPYRWFFKVQCDSAVTSYPISVAGSLYRVVPDRALAEKLQMASSAERVILYAENGFWFDALHTLAEMRLANPGDRNLITAWKRLLRSANIPEAIPVEPLQ